MRVLGHARSVALRREVLVGRLFGRLDLVTTIDAVLVAWSWFGSIQACLVIVSLIGHVENWLFAEQDANNRRVVAYLNQVLALRLCHERLELRCSKGINETGFRNNKKQDLGACKNRKLISLVVNKVSDSFIRRFIATSVSVDGGVNAGALRACFDATEDQRTAQNCPEHQFAANLVVKSR
jgi:hypothetical protein